MTDEEIKNKAKEISGGNYYYEQGFIYGFELGEENGRKEQEKKDKGFCETVCMKGGKIAELEKENAELKAQVEKMKFENDDLKNFLKNNIIQNTNIYLQSQRKNAKGVDL